MRRLKIDKDLNIGYMSKERPTVEIVMEEHRGKQRMQSQVPDMYNLDFWNRDFQI